MTITEYIHTQGLKPVDAIILGKKFFGMADHYALFMGFRNGTPVFVANYNNGVKEIPQIEIQKFLKHLQPKGVKKFLGNELQRAQAVARANSRIGEKAYNYWKNNCEHFVEWVHSGVGKSTQVANAADLSLATGVGFTLTGIVAEKPKTLLIGLGLLIAGASLKASSVQKE